MQLLTNDGTFLRVNQAFADMVGRPADELVGLNWRDVSHEDDQHENRRIRDELARGRRGEYQELKRYVRPDGTVVWGDMTVTAVFPHGAERLDSVLHLTQVIDVTERVRALEREQAANQRLRASERRYRSLVEPAPDAVIRCTTDGVVTDANRVAVAMLGRDPVIGQPLDVLLPAELAGRLMERVVLVGRTGRAETLWRERIEPRDRAPGWYLLRIVPEIDPDVSESNVFIVASEISELVENERRLADLALVDSVTGAASRVAVLDRLRHAIDGLGRRPGTGLAVAVIDLDGFKAVNDRHGHATGDAALAEAASAIRAAIRLDDTVGRLGGDEFCVVFENVPSAERAHRLAEVARDAIDATGVPGVEARLRASVGVAWTSTPVAPEQLLARADAEMYASKRLARRTNHGASTH